MDNGVNIGWISTVMHWESKCEVYCEPKKQRERESESTEKSHRVTKRGDLGGTVVEKKEQKRLKRIDEIPGGVLSFLRLEDGWQLLGVACHC